MKGDNLSTLIAFVSLALVIALPVLSVVPFGWLWLWQNGYLPYWLAATVVLSILVFAGRAALLSRIRKVALQKPSAASQGGRMGDRSDVGGADAAHHSVDDTSLPTPREAAALKAVEVLALDVDPKQLGSREDVIALGLRTVECVAREMHPSDENAIWQFTAPEALSLLERIAQRLRPMIIKNVPLGDRLTVGQVMGVYKWRSYLDVANKAYDLWRVLRLANPLAAATQEIRERMSKAAMEGLREDLAKRLAQAYVREVGQAAIELYSGRLRVSDDDLAGYVSAQTAADRSGQSQALSEPLRFLVAGQQGVGKTSLINALADDVQAAVDSLPATSDYQGYEVQRPGMPAVVLTDSPGLTPAVDVARIIENALASDLIIWVVPSNRADRALDADVLGSLRSAFAELMDRRPPPVVFVATHIDRLRPFNVWAPPYDIEDEDDAKSRAIRDALVAIGEDLQVSPSDIVPVSLAPERPAYNVDVVWAKLAERLPEAKSAQLLRCVRGADKGTSWRTVLSQAVGAGRVLARTLSRPKPRD
ncbi:MAG: GTPase [Pseudomonadota bacterium]